MWFYIWPASVIGIYTGKQTYYFSNNCVTETYPQMEFAIRKPAQEHTNAILLSGTHLEAAIPNSSLISNIDKDSSVIRQRYALFQEKRAGIFDNTVKLLNETFK